MARDLLASAFLVGLVVAAGCELFDHDQDSPDPTYLENHAHQFILHFHAENREADTVGFASVAFSGNDLLAARSADTHLSRDWATLGDFSGKVRFLFDDSGPHACTTGMSHFTGYQRRYGGDTSRFAAMDRYGEWQFELLLWSPFAVLRNGDTVAMQLYGNDLHWLPDTVRGDGALELDVTLDMDGLMSWDSTTARYRMNVDRVTVRQR